MANFTININADIVPDYTPIVQQRAYDLCSAVDNSYTVALTEGTPADLKIPLLNTCNATLKTLHITPVVLTNPTSLFFKYNTTQLTTVGVTTDINITGLSITDIIPLLSMELITLTPMSDGVTLDIAITDTDDITYPTVRSKFLVSVDACPVDPDPVLSNVTTVTAPTGCELGQAKAFTITAPTYSTVRIRYTVVDNGNHGFTGALNRTDTYDGTTVEFISGLTPIPDYTTDILINMGATGTKHFRACIEARPPIIAENNVCTVTLAVRNSTDTGDVGTITLTDTETWS